MDKLSDLELVTKIETAKQQIPIGSKWQHYKGGQYVVTDHVVIEATNEVGVVYIAVTHPTVKFLRPIVTWQDVVDYDDNKAYRFRRLGV